jgi:arginine utilization regulatory protein
MKDLFFKENILEILDYLEEGIHVIDKNGVIIYYNKFAQSLDGIDREKVVGSHLLEIYPSLTEETSTLLMAMRTARPVHRQEQTFLNYKGEKITTINSSMPIKSRGKILGALEISKDITNVRQMSERIVELQSKIYKNKKDNKKDNAVELAEFTFRDIIGKNKEMERLKILAEKAAETDVSVLIAGDTGTGKELFVHSIHNESNRKDKAFITQNCAALPGNLLEGILFGTIKGGFTGAEDRPGLFELADKGTLFLDEINSMPMELQSKLLRVLQDGRIRRVGATKTIDVDVRIIAATNVPPEEAVEKKQLRRDLYYRLNIVSFQIPALKNRKDDIPLLSKFFINKFNRKFGKDIEGISEEVLNIWSNYPWDGNVRELEHLIEGIMSITDKDIIEVSDLPPKFKQYNVETNTSDQSLNKALEDLEIRLIKDALKQTDYNVTKTAEILKIPRQTLQYRIQKLGIA